jgi:hypothetical protein
MGLGSVLLSEEWFIIIIDVVVDSGGRNCCTFDPGSSFMAVSELFPLKVSASHFSN